jgi:DNA-binding transcriptional LysR family regulator
MPTPLDTELLRTFVTIVETESFTASGEKLRRTQPAISMQMKRLEDAVGKPLFEQTRRGVRLTPEGDILLGYARRILMLSARAHEEIGRSSATDIVRLGTSDDYAALLLPGILQRFAAANPDVRIELVCGNGDAIERKLLDGAVDLALTARKGNVISADTLWSDNLVWVGAEGSSPMEQIQLAAFPQGCVCREIMTEALNAQGRAWTVIFESDNIGAIHATVRAGLGVTAVEERLVPEGVKVFGTAAGLPDLARVTLCLTSGAPERRSVAALSGALRSGLLQMAGSHASLRYAEASAAPAFP